MLLPAIIPKNLEEIQDKIDSVKEFVEWVHIDVMDGKFVLSKTFPYEEEGDPLDFKKLDIFLERNPDTYVNKNLKMEVHLMIDNPEEMIYKWVKSGAKRILVHLESLKIQSGSAPEKESAAVLWRKDFLDTDILILQDIKFFIDECKKADVEFGLVLNPDTPISRLTDIDYRIIRRLDVVQLMSVKPGSGGQEFIGSILDEISALRAKYPDMVIQVDGGVNLENAEKIIRAGANNLVAGSAVYKSGDVEEAIRRFKEIQI